MRPFTHDIQSKVALAIKNRIDISDLIVDVDLRNANLARAIITKFRRMDTDISNCNFAFSELGDSTNKDIFTIIRCKMQNCNFEGVRFVGTSWMRSCDAQNCNFRNADVSKVSYEHTDFRGCTFCDAVIKIGTKEGLGCIFPTEMFEQLTQGWKMKIKAEYLKE
jgi:uncharacterized protein YjbI with pentapeptide repeats